MHAYIGEMRGDRIKITTDRDCLSPDLIRFLPWQFSCELELLEAANRFRAHGFTVCVDTGSVFEDYTSEVTRMKKPSIEELEAAIEEGNSGFCIACGEQTSGVEPDARRYQCESCGARSVYGAEELLLMGCYQALEGSSRESA